jgi:periplasmic divalent cation tolerance protein
MGLVVLVTIPQNKANNLTKIILKERLAACVNIIESVASYFWWKGKIDKAKEALLIIKTKEKLYPKLKTTIKKYHPYTVPEIIGIKIDKINKKYLNWLLEETLA